jgi:AraC-like DNA-binding protein
MAVLQLCSAARFCAGTFHAVFRILWRGKPPANFLIRAGTAKMATVKPVAAMLPRRRYRSGYTVLRRHRHSGSYLALVLAGAHEEAGDRGCHRVHAGDAILHGPFEAHLNRYACTGADVLDLPLPFWTDCTEPVVQLADADEIARTAERDPQQAVQLAFSKMQPVDRRPRDWPQRLAEALQLDPHLRLEEWARAHGLASATVSRGFSKVFGISPSAFRAQLRARAALKLTVSSGQPLVQIALDAGFCDQAHMTRAVHAISGRPPGMWRHSVK